METKILSMQYREKVVEMYRIRLVLGYYKYPRALRPKITLIDLGRASAAMGESREPI